MRGADQPEDGYLFVHRVAPPHHRRAATPGLRQQAYPLDRNRAPRLKARPCVNSAKGAAPELAPERVAVARADKSAWLERVDHIDRIVLRQARRGGADRVHQRRDQCGSYGKVTVEWTRARRDVQQQRAPRMHEMQLNDGGCFIRHVRRAEARERRCARRLGELVCLKDLRASAVPHQKLFGDAVALARANVTRSDNELPRSPLTDMTRLLHHQPAPEDGIRHVLQVGTRRGWRMQHAQRRVRPQSRRLNAEEVRATIESSCHFCVWRLLEGDAGSRLSRRHAVHAWNRSGLAGSRRFILPTIIDFYRE